MRVRRMALGTLMMATLAVAVAAPAAAEDAKPSKSSVQAAALAKQLAQAKLQVHRHQGSDRARPIRGRDAPPGQPSC